MRPDYFEILRDEYKRLNEILKINTHPPHQRKAIEDQIKNIKELLILNNELDKIKYSYSLLQYMRART